MKFKNFKTEYILLSVSVVGGALIFGSFLKQLNFTNTSQQLERGGRVEIVDGDVIEQKFISQNNRLNNLRILFGNKKLQEYNSVKFTLADKNCQKKISEKVLRGKYDFDSKYLYNFYFPKIKNSKNKEYCLKIKLETEKKWSTWRKIKSKIWKNKKIKMQKVRLFEDVSENNSNKISKNNSNKIKNYIIKNKSGKIEGEGQFPIFFQTSYKNKNIWQDLNQLNQRMSQYKPWFLKGKYLTIMLLLVFITTGYTLKWLIKR